MTINAKTSIYGIIGYPLGHSLSPAMHNAGFEAAGINAIYLAFPMKNIINIKYSMRQFGIKGLSVTIPYKVKIKRILDQVDPLAIQVGSVNTILWNKSGLLTGYTTDGEGAMDAIIEAAKLVRNKNVLVIGSGGSARSIIFSLLKQTPAKLGIMARNISTTRGIVRGIRAHRSHPQIEVLWSGLEKNSLPRIKPKHETILKSPEQIHEYDMIIQTTPMGMSGHPDAGKSPLMEEYLRKDQTLFDIVYSPQETPLVKLARKKKIDVIPGYKMLLHQGVRQFELFTGTSAPIDVMEKVLKSELAKI